METQISSPNPPVAAAPRSVSIQVAGGDLLLRGRFRQWLPLVLADGGADGKGTAQILFDVTSTGAAPGPREPDLFTFTSASVSPLGEQSYKVKGQLRSEGHTRTVEAVLQSPPAHTPFFVILFPIERETFPELWATLEARVARTEQQELRPQAWLRAPELAAA